MFNRTLPIGSVVLLKNASKRLMIIGYCRRKSEEDNTIFDYVGCIYPEGFMNVNTTALFNHEDIEHIFSLGFQNEQRFQFEEILKEELDRVKPF